MVISLFLTSLYLIWKETVQTSTTAFGGDERIRQKTGITWPQLGPNTWSTTRKHMCLTRSKSRQGTSLDQDLSPMSSSGTRERTVSRGAATKQLNLVFGLFFHFLFPWSAPTDAPTDLRVSKVDTNRAHIHWKPVDLKSVQGEFKEYRVRQNHTDSTIAFYWSFLSLSIVPPPSCTTGVIPVWFLVLWSVKRSRPKVSIALYQSHRVFSVSWCRFLSTRCSWLWPTLTTRVHPATQWSSPRRREVRTKHTKSPALSSDLHADKIAWTDIRRVHQCSFVVTYWS